MEFGQLAEAAEHCTQPRCLLGHSKLESTVGYLGIEVVDAIEIAEKIDI
jgi:hypothetical protein